MTLTGLAFHAYGGSVVYGMHEAGIEVLASLEPSEFRGFGTECQEANFPGHRIVVGDPSSWNTKEFRGVGAIVGNPPCAGFSTMSHGLVKDPGWYESRTCHLHRAIDLLDAVRPRVWAMESVRRLETTGSEICRKLEKRALAAGYSVTYWRHDLRQFGCPQRRKRVFAIAHRVEITLPLVQRNLFARDSPEVRLVGEVLDSVSRPGRAVEFKPGMAEMWEKTRQGEQLRTHVDSGDWPDGLTRPNWLAVRLDRDDFAPTMLGDPWAYCHPDEVRSLGLDEMSAMFGYPPDWIWPAERVNQNWAMAAKASLPPAARSLGTVIARALRNDVAVDSPRVQAVTHKYDERSREFTEVRETHRMTQ